MTVIVDPFDPDNAIVNGERAFAVRLLSFTSVDPAAPRYVDLQGGTIIGYATDASWSRRPEEPYA